MTATATELDAAAVAAALEHARHLAAHGVPMFLARPALDEDGQWDATGGHNGCGYWIPTGWERTQADPATVDQWRPGMALAAVMGHTVDGADVDPRHGGDVTAAQLRAEGLWPRSYGRQATPSGGWHDLIAPLGVRSRDGVLPGVDVKAGHEGRGHGFLFIAPTVKLGKTGEIAPYVWTTVPDLNELTEHDDTGDVLAARIGALRAAEDDAPDLPHEAHDAMSEAQRAAAGRYLAAAVAGMRDELTEAATWPVGHRDEHNRGWQKLTADAANRLGRLARADWTPWTYAEARAVLAQVVPPVIARAVPLDQEWAAQRDRRGPAPYPASLAEDWTAGLPVTLGTLGERAAEAHARAAQVAEVEHLAPEPEAVEDAAERARRLFPRLDWQALWADDSEDEWIHYPLLPARRSVVIYSPPKVGKSLLVLEMAVAISRAGTFLGHRVERRWRVLYVDFENDPRGDVRSRLQAMGYGPDDLDHLDYLSYPTMAGLDTERGSLELLEAVKAYGAEVVVIDTVSRAVEGEENSNDTWLGLYRRTGLKLKQAGVAMLRLDHTGKDESKGQRGGSAKSGDVDAVWKLTRVTDTRFRMECTDARLPIEAKSLHLTRHTTPRLHHAADVLKVQTEREAKVAHLVQLADSNDLPADAGRDRIKLLAQERGIKARNDVYAEVARVRKAAADLSPTIGDRDPLGDRSELSPPRGDSTPPEPTLTSADTCPRPSGTAGDSAHRPPPVPVPRSLERDSGTAGQTEDDEHPPCASCGGLNTATRDAAGLDCLDCYRTAEDAS